MTAVPRIAILTHSTNPRGGVVHALELGDALTRLGLEATVLAPDIDRNGFFRRTLCATSCVPASPAGRDTRAMVETRVADYVRYFEDPDNRRFDIWHAQDGISANALGILKERGFISGFGRTVHHVDAFEDERLIALQRRSIMAADQLFVVSELWRDWLAREFKRDACIVGNGVDRKRFSPQPDDTDAELREELGLRPSETVFLAIGGVEERKNTVRLLRAFLAVRLQIAESRLVIAGGASILDHGAYQAQFVGVLSHAGDTAAAVMRTGPLRQRLMPALYRAASCLVCASMKEGFGLVVLEAMASGVPAVVSGIAPFTEYLGGDDALWCDPSDVSSIAAAMMRSVDRAQRALLFERGMRLAAQHDWISVAKAHVAAYQKLRDKIYA
jgi:glycosyltransferase-like protein